MGTVRIPLKMNAARSCKIQHHRVGTCGICSSCPWVQTFAYARPFEVIVDHKALERLVAAKSDFPTVQM